MGYSFNMNGLRSVTSVSLRSLMLGAAAVSLPLGPVLAQARPAAPAPRPAAGLPPKAAPVARPPAPAAAGPAAAAPIAPPGAPEAAQAEAPALPPPLWDVMNAQDLLYYIRQIGREGLEPADYDPAGLEAALASGD